MAAAAREAVERVVRLLTAAAAHAGNLSGDERTELVSTIDAAVAHLTTARAALLVAQRDSGAWRRHGDPTFEAWRARTSRAGIRAAATEVRRGDALATMPAMREAVEDGRVTIEHLDVVARTAAGASAPVRDVLATGQGQTQLLELASRVDAGRFAKAATQWAATIDRSALERSHQAQRAARFLHLADTPDGTRLTAQVDAVAGHRLRLALEAVAGKPAADDVRSPAQRRADALTTLADAALSMSASDGVPVGPRATVTFVLREQTWVALRDDERAAAAGTVAGRSLGSAGGAAGGSVDGPADGPVDGPAARPARLTGVLAVPPATLEDGAPLPPSETARMLCDCELTRLVLDADGQPLDLGRSVRRYTAAQRRAVTVRDGGCFWPGCGAPTRWCEVHHLVWWDHDGGETRVVDGALACSFHHHELHRRTLTIARYLLPAGSTGGHAEPRVAYVVTTSSGDVLADGRPPDPGGGSLGRELRRWVPGTGAMDPPEAGAPADLDASADPRPREPVGPADLEASADPPRAPTTTPACAAPGAPPTGGRRPGAPRQVTRRLLL